MSEQLLKIIEQKIERLQELNEIKASGIKNSEIILSEAVSQHLPTILGLKDVNNLKDYAKLKTAYEELTKTLKIILEEEKEKKFLETGNNFDEAELRRLYKANNIKKKFPTLDFEKYLHRLNNPLEEITNFNGETIKYDLYWVKKNLIAINQMLFNEMDLYILNIGKEGSGKSCWSSQQMLYFYTFLKEVGLIQYEYDPKKMFFVDLESFLQNHEVQKKNDYFRIECMDEGNELNRNNFREETNQQFKYEMRTERKMLRIILLNMQQIGELDTSISLSRVNFIYNCQVKSSKTSGLLRKGYIDMYIIPRGTEIYSEKHKKKLSRQEILNIFANRLDKKKDYYVSLPSELVVKNFRFHNFWGFDKDEYDDHVKDSIQERKFAKKMKLTDNQAYLLMTKFIRFTDLVEFDRKNNPNDKKKYDTLHKFFKRIEKYFESNQHKLLALQSFYGDNVKKQLGDEIENYLKE